MAKCSALIVCTSFFLILLGTGTTGCGGSVMNSGRMLQSLTVTPASADAQTFPGGRVQFTVTGTFNMVPVTVASPVVMWSIGSPFAPPSPTMPQASVNATGLAQCNGFVGTTLVEATAPSEPEIPLQGMTPSTPAVSGTATLICP
ncbi:MAG TPA: hypothetical protein VI488_07370 [Candidatus Angelobacter sp.]